MECSVAPESLGKNPIWGGDLCRQPFILNERARLERRYSP